MTFIIKSKSSEGWKAISGAISTLVDEATFEVNADGVTFRGMDPSHIALIDIKWPNHLFEKFVCDSSVKFGIRVDEFSKVLKRADKKDTVELTLGDDSMLAIRLEGDYKREFKTRLIESSAGSTPLPKLNFKAKAVMTVTLFDKLLSDVQVSSEFLTLDAKAGTVFLQGRNDSGEVHIPLTASDIEELSVQEDTKATYSLDYISKIVKAVVAQGGSVVAEWSSKMPCRLELRPEGATVHFYLAPRVADC